MKLWIFVCLAALLSACTVPSFVGDARPVPETSVTPDHFDLPARFAVARVVYGRVQAAGTEEAELWTEMANRAEGLGSFAPFINGSSLYLHNGRKTLIETARTQRYNYLLVVQMYPSSGSAEIVLYHVGSGGVMATAQAVSPAGGQNGFWGNEIRNPARLERATLRIARATMPTVEEMLRGVALRQR